MSGALNPSISNRSLPYRFRIQSSLVPRDLSSLFDVGIVQYFLGFGERLIIVFRRPRRRDGDALSATFFENLNEITNRNSNFARRMHENAASLVIHAVITIVQHGMWIIVFDRIKTKQVSVNRRRTVDKKVRSLA